MVLCTSTVFTLGQRAGVLLKWEVPWKVLPSLLKLSESPEARAFALVSLYVYVQSLPLLGDVDATVGKLQKWGTVELRQALKEIYPLGKGYHVRMTGDLESR